MCGSEILSLISVVSRNRFTKKRRGIRPQMSFIRAIILLLPVLVCQTYSDLLNLNKILS